MNTGKIFSVVATVAAVTQLLGCASGAMMQAAEDKGAKQIGEVMKADGYTDTEVSQFQRKLKDREGYAQVWKERMANDSNRVKKNGVNSSFSVIDNEYDRTCGFAGDYGTQLKTNFNKSSGLLFPVYSVDTEGNSIYDEPKTIRLHNAMTSAGIKLLPVSETRKFNQVAIEYMKKIAAIESKDAGKGGFAAVGGAMSKMAEMGTAEVYRTPFNTINFYNEVLIKFPSASYTIGDSSEQTALERIKLDFYYNSLGLPKSDVVMAKYGGINMDYYQSSIETKMIASKTNFYNGLIGYLKRSGASLQITTMAEYKNRTQTPGIKTIYSGYCNIESYSDQMEVFVQKEKLQKEMDKIGGIAAKSFMTMGLSNVADLVSAKSNEKEMNAKAKSELDQAVDLYREAMKKSDSMYYSQLIPFISKSFQELEVSGFTKSNRLK